MPPAPRFITAPAAIAALIAAGIATGLMTGGRASDSMALVAASAALFAAHERRYRDMLVAAAIGVASAPAGLLLAPLFVGLAIGRGAARHLPVAVFAGLLLACAAPWCWPQPALPNLAQLATARPDSLALCTAIGVGLAAWLGARASIATGGALFAEARLGIILLAAVLPLPMGAIAFVVMAAALPLPAVPTPRAANDNVVARRVVRLAA